MKPRCQGPVFRDRIASPTACGRAAQPGSVFCWQHKPAQADLPTFKVWQLDWHSLEVHSVLAERLTESSVWIRGDRAARRTIWYAIFETWDEAVEAAKNAAVARVERASAALAAESEILSKVMNMQLKGEGQ